MTTLNDTVHILRDLAMDCRDDEFKPALYRRMAELVEAAQALREAKRCPNCEDDGWWVRAEPHTGEAEQMQCQWCYETADSRFNALAALDKLEQEP